MHGPKPDNRGPRSENTLAASMSHKSISGLILGHRSSASASKESAVAFIYDCPKSRRDSWSQAIGRAQMIHLSRCGALSHLAVPQSRKTMECVTFNSRLELVSDIGMEHYKSLLRSIEYTLPI